MFETYPHFQEGDYVKVVRWWKRGENGIPFGFLDPKHMEHIIGKIGRIEEISTSSYCTVHYKDVPGGHIYAPFFVLEKVQKP